MNCILLGCTCSHFVQKNSESHDSERKIPKKNPESSNSEGKISGKIPSHPAKNPRSKTDSLGMGGTNFSHNQASLSKGATKLLTHSRSSTSGSLTPLLRFIIINYILDACICSRFLQKNSESLRIKLREKLEKNFSESEA
jgi:hypothetical protein